MTSNKFSSNSFFNHRVRSHWYLSLISAIGFFLSGPFVLILNINQVKSNYDPAYSSISLYETIARTVTRFFEKSDIAFMYVLAYTFATIIGLILFSYLNSKKQVNFYHSQPLSRKKLFFSNYFAAIFLGIIPLIIMVILATIIAISTIGFGSYLFTLPMHIFSFLAFYCAGLSITALACQITGSTLFAIYAMGFINFFLTVIIAFLSSLVSELSATIYISAELSAYVSPVTYFVTKIVGYNSHFTVLQIASYSILAIVVAMISYMLYLIRPSEIAGSTIVHKPIGGFIKYVSAFIFAVSFGFITSGSGGGFTIFLMSFSGFFFISCLFMQVAYRRSFRSMKKILPSTIIATIVAAAGIYGLSIVSENLDKKVPQANEVTTMTFNFVDNIISQYGEDEVLTGVIDDPQLISQALDIISKIVADNNYDSGYKSLSHSTKSISEENINTTNITVQYNNSLIRRTYYRVDIDLIMDELSQIYENPKYKATFTASLEKAMAENKTVSWFNLDTNIVDSYEVRYNYDAPREEGDYVQDDKYVKLLTEAIIKDIKASKYKDLNNNGSYYGNIGFNYQNFSDNTNYLNMNFMLFESYYNVREVINQMVADPEYTQFVSFNPTINSKELPSTHIEIDSTDNDIDSTDSESIQTTETAQ